jgi:hypothetical protein
VHAWAWLSAPVQRGAGGQRGAGAAAGAAVAAAQQRSLVVAGAGGAPEPVEQGANASAYFTQTLQTWEQGRFIRFNGLAQWLGWLWPYAALAYVLLRLSRREPKN